MLKELIKNAETRRKGADARQRYLDYFVGGEVFERASEIVSGDKKLAVALLQELSSVLSMLGSKNCIDVDKLVIDSLKEYHEELFETEE